ncbi:hypothetical protein P389DRAFT_5130 [Cystobasidium minutum MCA 4210]|uniref:uncharacterized protein n=1 Tax=Cystobasidium minutum MCA 4210 TaxID=1397322 RepID=UPI0034CEC7BF|eukprot:jgi/Rhomi1/5130/CE5129_38
MHLPRLALVVSFLYSTLALVSAHALDERDVTGIRIAMSDTCKTRRGTTGIDVSDKCMKTCATYLQTSSRCSMALNKHACLCTSDFITALKKCAKCEPTLKVDGVRATAEDAVDDLKKTCKKNSFPLCKPKKHKSPKCKPRSR